MKYTPEQYEAFYYLNKLLPYLKTLERYERNLVDINNMNGGDLLFSLPRREDDRGYTKKETQEFCEKIESALAEHGTIYSTLPIPEAQRNISYLSKVLQLKEQEEKIVRFLGAVYTNKFFKKCLQEFNHDLYEREDTLTAAADCPVGTGYSFLNDNAPLKRLGIIKERRFNSDFQLTSWAQEFISTAYKSNTARSKALVGAPLPNREELTSRDFPYVEASDFALRLMKCAKRMKGFNILLYGIPGTGKTSFAKMLAKSAKLNLYTVGICNNGDDEKNFRLQQFYRKQFSLKNIKDACLLFDEGEDMFSSPETRASKMEINNLLENNEVPVIWTTNKIHRMDSAFIRRFTLAICFNKPPTSVREKIWNKYLTQNKISCSKKDLNILAKKYDVPPSMIESSTRATHMVKGNLETVKTHLSLMRQALNGGYKKAENANRVDNFCPALIHADMDLNALTEQVKGLGRLNFSLCLYGASGTGKSAYARYLAEQMGLEVIQQRASDLISPFVGETEENIAEAFSEAKDAKAMLIFDEADTFLRDRSLAARSWEVSSVNEMLTWMESHPYPFICTTNLMDTLDPASLRRFSFKVKYDFLTSEQVRTAFKHFFDMDVSCFDINGLDKLTPGDFALVKNKAEILGKSTQLSALREMLETEQKLKRNVTGGIGFHVN